MQTREIAVFGVTATTEVSSSADEMNSLAGRDVCHDLAVNQVDFHILRGRIRSNVVSALETQFPNNLRARETAKEGDKEVVTITEKDAQYIARLKAEGAIDTASLTQTVASVTAGITWQSCLVARERQAPSLPKKLAEKLDLLDAVQLEKLARKLGKKLNREIDPNDKVAIGRAYQEKVKLDQESELANL